VTYQLRHLHDWPATVAEAEAIQERLRSEVDTVGPGPRSPGTVAGLDVAYADDGRLAAAVAVLDATTLEVLESAVATGVATFPYVPGLFAFRELPTLIAALRRLTLAPDVLVCDGYGVAHPRGFGLASHLGLLTGASTIGVAKTAFIGRYREPGPDRGDFSPLLDGERVVGRVLRTRAGVRPVFVSVGHRVDLETATALVLRLTPRYRLPETTRVADRLSRRRLRSRL
jgi:deoxyribonuclease V